LLAALTVLLRRTSAALALALALHEPLLDFVAVPELAEPAMKLWMQLLGSGAGLEGLFKPGVALAVLESGQSEMAVAFALSCMRLFAAQRPASAGEFIRAGLPGMLERILEEGAFVLVRRSVGLIREIVVHAGEEGCAAFYNAGVVRALSEYLGTGDLDGRKNFVEVLEVIGRLAEYEAARDGCQLGVVALFLECEGDKALDRLEDEGQQKFADAFAHRFLNGI
jgi:hypothetical protein